MKEKGYRNPYLDEVIKVDRSEEFKKFENNKQRLELIDYLKSNRKYSQDPSKLKYIQSELDIEMYKKRKKMYLNEYKNKEKQKQKKKKIKEYMLIYQKNMKRIKNYLNYWKENVRIIKFIIIIYIIQPQQANLMLEEKKQMKMMIKIKK